LDLQLCETVFFIGLFYRTKTADILSWYSLVWQEILGRLWDMKIYYRVVQKSFYGQYLELGNSSEQLGSEVQGC